MPPPAHRGMEGPTTLGVLQAHTFLNETRFSREEKGGKYLFAPWVSSLSGGGVPYAQSYYLRKRPK
jgi:hypothetical protein